MGIENRESPRYIAHWRIAIVFDETENRSTIHGHTYDLSLSGTSIHTDHNIISNTPVTILLSPPVAYEGERQKIIEAKAKLAYSVYSGSNFCFRVGLHFIQFKNDGMQVLEDILNNLPLVIPISKP